MTMNPHIITKLFKLITSVVVLAIALVWGVSSANASDGSLDGSFAGDGSVSTQVRNNRDAAFDMAMQADGKIVVVGTSYSGTDNDFAIVRYNSDGSLDNSFSGDGKAVIYLTAGNDVAYAVALQSDHKIVVSGFAIDQVATIRLDQNGDLDATFGSNGIKQVSLGSASDSYDVVIQNDGKIVVIGFQMSSNYDFTAIRYLSNGSLDINYGNGGVVAIDFGSSSDDQAFGASLDSLGRIVAVGSTKLPSGSNRIGLVRILDNGSLDPSFGIGGRVVTSVFSGEEVGEDVVIQPDGRIVVVGFAVNGNGIRSFVALRYLTDGNPDGSFGVDGYSVISFGSGSDQARSVVLQKDGRIVLGGRSNNGVRDMAALVRLTSGGVLDPTFDSDGRFQFDIDSRGSSPYSIALQKDSRIVVSGIVGDLAAASHESFDFGVARVLASSSVSSLAGLSVSVGGLSPAFSSTGFSYSVEVANPVSSVTLTPLVTDLNSSVRVNGVAVASGVASGGISLGVGVNNVSVVVTAQDGVSVSTYSVVVTRAEEFVAMSPIRLMDTRSGQKVGEIDGSGSPYMLQVTGVDVPVGTTAVALNVSVVDGETGDFSGYVTVYPCGGRPDTSNLNFVDGQTIPNSVISSLSSSGKVCLYVFGRAHLLVDVTGYMYR